MTRHHFDIKRIISDPEAYDAMLASRGYPAAAQRIEGLDRVRREALTTSQTTQSERKKLSEQIGKAIKAGAQGLADRLRARAEDLGRAVEMADYDARAAGERLDEILLQQPNWPDEDVPPGLDESHNVEEMWWNTSSFAMRVRGSRDGEPHWSMDHVQLGLDVASKISGARFSMLHGPVARLHRALGQFMLDSHVDRGYREVIPPTIVRRDALVNTGQLPKFEDDLFSLTNHDDREYLIPTGEVPLTNMLADQVIAGDHRFVALTECYRAEAGSAGRDTRGLIRQHQFQKVELVTICEPQSSDAEHQYMLESAEAILRALELPYRRVLLCRGDMGFGAAKTYDLEVWLPGQNAYREISSVSNCRADTGGP